MEITQCPPVNKSSDRHKINEKRKDYPKITQENIKSFSCNICPRKGKCTELCPPMEWIVSKVEVEPGKEKPTPADYRQTYLNNKFPDGLSTTENIFLMYFFDRKEQQEIADMLYISRQYVNRAINQVKEIILQNLRKNGCEASI